jgi:hypothetical protein
MFARAEPLAANIGMDIGKIEERGKEESDKGTWAFIARTTYCLKTVLPDHPPCRVPKTFKNVILKYYSVILKITLCHNSLYFH